MKDTLSKSTIEFLRKKVKPLTATQIGSLYEKSTQAALKHRFAPCGLKELQIVGQAGDRGVDLVGTWKSIDLLVQCKARSSPISSDVWRDIGGVYSQRVSESNQPTLIALASPMPMTSAAFSEFTNSLNPYMHVILPKFPACSQAAEGKSLARIHSVTTNLAAQNMLQAHEISLS